MPRQSDLEELMSALETILKFPDWGNKKISQYMQREEMCYLCPSTVYRIKKEQLNKWDIAHHPNPYYQPSYNGKTERKNRDLRKIVDRFDEDASLEQIFSTVSDSIYEHNHIRPHESLGGATPYQSYNCFADEVRAKMEAFKKREKRRKGFKVDDSKQNQNHNAGVRVPVYSRNDSNDIVGFVKSFLEIRL